MYFFLDDERAQSLLEYAIIIALVGVGAVIVLALFGADLGEAYQNLVEALQEALDPG